MDETLINLIRRAAAHARAGRAVYGCLVIKARGSTPQTAGSLMLVDEAAGAFGTIGGGCVEAEARRRAFEMLARGETGCLSFSLDHDYGWDDGLICGGTIDVAVGRLPAADRLERILADLADGHAAALDLEIMTETGPARYAVRIPPRERLYVAGAGHVGRAVARLALALDFDVTVFDDRHDLLQTGLPDGAVAQAGDIAGALAAASIDERTYCVVVTRGHRHDEQALASVLNRGARYVGMIGSRRKVKLIFDDLRSRGVPDETLAAVHAPIGLAIGAVTVEEIAVSIAAQLVEVRREAPLLLVDGPLAVITETGADGAAADAARSSACAPSSIPPPP